MKLLFSIPWQFNLLQLLTIIAFFLIIVFIAYPFIHMLDAYSINSYNESFNSNNKKISYFSDKGEMIASIVTITFTIIYIAFSFYVIVNHGKIINSFLDDKSHLNNLTSLLSQSTFVGGVDNTEEAKFVLSIILSRLLSSFTLDGTIIQTVINEKYGENSLYFNVKWTIIILVILSLISLVIIASTIYRNKNKKKSSN